MNDAFQDRKDPMQSRVSLSMPVRNGARFVAEAIGSILAQTYPDFELLITDNASTDATEEICRAFARKDSRVRYHRNERDLGAAGNYNLGFHRTSGEYFKWCAHDDLLSPNYLAECIRALDDTPEAATAYGQLRRIDVNGALDTFVEPGLPGLASLPPHERMRALLPMHTIDGATFGLHRRSVLAKTDLHRPYYTSDCVLLTEIVLLGTVICVPQATFFNREHPNRSVNLHSTDRLAWQNPSAAGGTSFEVSQRVGHLFAVAFRHRRVVPLHRTLPLVVRWTANPVILGRMSLELVGVVSPKARQRLRSAGLVVLGAIVERSSRLSDKAGR